MKYIKIKGYDLVTVLGDAARSTDKLGLSIFPEHQMIDKDRKISYGAIYNESLFIVEHPAITFFDTVAEVNADIDIEYDVIFMISDIEKLKLDIEFSGGIGAVNGYFANKSLDSQDNLLILLQRDMAGISINKKADYFI